MKRKVVFGVVCALAAFGGFGSYCYAGTNTVSINGIDFNSDTLEEDIAIYLRNNKPVFEASWANDCVTYNFDISEITGRSFIDKIADSLLDRDYILTYTTTIDEDRLRTECASLGSSSFDAYITKTDGEFDLVPEEYGTKVDSDALIKAYYDKSDDVIYVEDYYIQPEVTKADLVDIYNQLLTYSNWSVEYYHGETIKSSADYVLIDSDYNITLDYSFIESQYETAVESYNTVGNTWVFTTHNDENIEIEGGTWGSLVDYEKELEFLKTSFQSGVSVENRFPEYSQHYEALGNSFIEVSLEEQHVWVYEDTRLVMETDCVTGNTGLNRNTPTGIYFISEMVDGKYLRGADYTTWVNKWMRLTNSGIGLHDAYWRSSFGGSIYTYNGSHGCINLPKKFAYNLYDIAFIGEPVIIY